ncbi:hypothetical protein ACFOKJ_07270 [Vogesella amnigena]|uniref:Uncharacterized protein n=1 Tax=Vogesella amnigena TaxID=1507449 RepID=A0ABV7TT65_9NEIS
MRITKYILPIAIFSTTQSYANEQVAINIDDQTKLYITTEKSIATIKLKSGKLKKQKSIDMDSEKSIHIEVYKSKNINNKYFSIWHIDDGMGVYKIYRFFIYLSGRKNIVEIKPKCADEFINIKLIKASTIIESSYYNENTISRCFTDIKKATKTANSSFIFYK